MKSKGKLPKSAIEEGVDVDRLKEPEKRRQSRMYKDDDEEKMNENETKDVVDTIVERYLTEQESAEEENTLKIKIVANFQSSTSEEEQESKYTTIAKLQVGQKTAYEKQDEIPIKTFKTTKGKWPPEERKPP